MEGYACVNSAPHDWRQIMSKLCKSCQIFRKWGTKQFWANTLQLAAMSLTYLAESLYGLFWKADSYSAGQ